MPSFFTKLGRSIMAAKAEETLARTEFSGNALMKDECLKMRENNIRYAIVGICNSRQSGSSTRPEAEYCIFEDPACLDFDSVRFKFGFSKGDKVYYMTFRVKKTSHFHRYLNEYRSKASDYFDQEGTNDDNEALLIKAYDDWSKEMKRT